MATQLLLSDVQREKLVEVVISHKNALNMALAFVKTTRSTPELAVKEITAEIEILNDIYRKLNI